MEKTLHDISTGNQPDGFTYETFSSSEAGELYFKKANLQSLALEEPGVLAYLGRRRSQVRILHARHRNGI